MIDKGSVKKILLTLLFASLANLATAQIPYNLSKDRNYIRHELDGFTYMLHPTLRAEGTDATLFTVKTINKYFLRLGKMLPDTVKLFKKENFKIFLLDDKNLFGGLELVREGQSKWDKRHSTFTEKSIIIARAYKFSIDDSLFPFVLHEMAHFHHKRVIGFKFNHLLRQALEKAKRTKRYGGNYAVQSNLYEYFAEISTAYLLTDAYGFAPEGSHWLFKFDRTGYDLCAKIWGKSLAAYTEEAPLGPPPNIEGFPAEHAGKNRAATIPIDLPEPFKLQLRKPKLLAEGEKGRSEPLNEGDGAIKIDPAKVDIWGLPDSHEERAAKEFAELEKALILIDDKYLEARHLITKAETEESLKISRLRVLDAYREAFFMLRDIKEDHPKYNPVIIKGLIKKVERRISIWQVPGVFSF